MQRLFSMFPSGLPGIGLLLLRLSVAFTMLLHVCARREELTATVLVGSLFLAISLFAGFLTPIVAFLATAVQFPGLWSLSASSTALAGASMLNAVALTLLGPGAYSFDALRFGRRVVHLPPGDEG